MAGLHNEAINTLLSADSIVDPQNSNQRLLVHGLLATNYRENHHPLAGRIHLDQAKGLVETIENPNERNKRLANIHQEMAYMWMEEKEYNKAIDEIRKSIASMDKMSTDVGKKFSYALNYQIIGDNYLKLSLPDSAARAYDISLKTLKESNSPESTLKGFILLGLAKTELAQDDAEKAKNLLLEAEDIGLKANNETLLTQVYAALTSFYKNKNDADNYILYNEKYLETLKLGENREKSISSELAAFLYPPAVKKELPKEPFYWEYALIVGILASSGFVIYRKRRTAKKIDNEEVTALSPVEPDKKSDWQKDYMTDEAMDAIVEKLKALEDQKFYLNNSLSLGSVASEVGVNHRYLSHTVHQKFDKDFASYINELRIQYIVAFLQENPKHLHYKISYLAEISGFSSHNRFSITFKKVLGISPSELIQELQEKHNQKI